MPRYRVIFVHIFKAGGTSIGNWLAEHYKEVATPTSAMAFKKDPHQYEADLIKGHMQVPDALKLKGYEMVTVVRKPESQIMSALWHCASNQTSELKHKQLTDAGLLRSEAEKFAVKLSGMQSLFISPAEPSKAPEVLDLFRAVGITERASDSLRLMAWRLRLPPPVEVPHSRNSGAGRTEMPDDIRELLHKHFQFDVPLYKRACELFEKGYSELVEAAGSDRSSDIDRFLAANAEK